MKSENVAYNYANFIPLLIMRSHLLVLRDEMRLIGPESNLVSKTYEQSD